METINNISISTILIISGCLLSISFLIGIVLGNWLGFRRWIHNATDRCAIYCDGERYKVYKVGNEDSYNLILHSSLECACKGDCDCGDSK